MINLTLLAIDVAKNVFQLHGIDAKGNKVLKKRIKRKQLAEFVAQLPTCTIAMETCYASNYWARKF